MDTNGPDRPAPGPRVLVDISRLSSSSSYGHGFDRLLLPDLGGNGFPSLDDLSLQVRDGTNDVSLPRAAKAFGAVGTEKTKIPAVVSPMAARERAEKV